MHAHNVRAEFFHFLKVLRDGGPLSVPVVFEKAAAVVVIVVEAPRLEGTAGRVQDKSALVGRDADGFEGRRFGGEESEGESERGQHADDPQQGCEAQRIQPRGAAR